MMRENGSSTLYYSYLNVYYWLDLLCQANEVTGCCRPAAVIQ